VVETKGKGFLSDEEEEKVDPHGSSDQGAPPDTASGKPKSGKGPVKPASAIDEKSDFSVTDPINTGHVTYTVKGKDSEGDFEGKRRYNDFFHLRNALLNRWPG
jgi:hypothetical protein